MTITYRTAGAWGAGKGSNLTAAEVDGSFYDLHGRVVTLETTETEPNGISNITITGTQMYVHLDDATVLGPYTLPQANFRPSIVSTVSATGYTLTVADANCYKRCTNAAGCAVLVPPNSVVAIPVSSEYSFVQRGAGPVSFTEDTGVTVNNLAGFLLQTAAVGSVVTLKKVATDEWDLIGHVAEDL